MLSAADVLWAKRNLQDVVDRTPLSYSSDLSAASGAEIYLKWENLQKTGSFKVRGAYHKISSNEERARRRGVITASAGNHGIAVAYAARLLGLRATVVLPTSAPRVKVDRCRALGAQVVLRGSYYDESLRHCMDLVADSHCVYVPATEDVDVMAGQGTVACEVLEELPDVETLIVPIGGGGLISGMAVWAKAQLPHLRILGVQSTATRTMYECFRARKLLTVPYRPTLADGLAGGTTLMKLDLVLEYVDDIVLVPEESLKPSILWLLEHEGQLAEGAGIVGPAALLEGRVPLEGGEKTVVVISGGNIDTEVLQIPSMRS